MGFSSELTGLSIFLGPEPGCRGSSGPYKDLMPQVFPAKFGSRDTGVLNLLPEPQVARFIRLLPQTWLQGGASLPPQAEVMALPVSVGEIKLVGGHTFSWEFTIYCELILYQIPMVRSLRFPCWGPPTH